MAGIYRSWPLPGTEFDEAGLIEAYRRPDRAEPWLRVNFVMSADGAATQDGLSGGLSSASDKKVFGLLRRLCDVVLVGAGTVRIEGYGAMVLGARSARWRAEHGLPEQPVFGIVSGALELDPRSPVFAEAPVRPIVFTSERAPAARREELQRVADVVVCGAAEVDPAAMMAALAERGLTQVLCEGGPTLFGTLLRADRVDELCLTLSPKLEGGEAIRIVRGALDQPIDLELAQVLVAGDELILRYLRSS